MKYLLIDTDVGTDDALAVWIAAEAHKDEKIALEIVGITCVTGNAPVHHVVSNVAQVLNVKGLFGVSCEYYRYLFNGMYGYSH